MSSVPGPPMGGPGAPAGQVMQPGPPRPTQPAGPPASPATTVPPPAHGDDTKAWFLRATKALAGFAYIIVLVNLVLLTLGFVLQLFGASTDAEFTRWVYRSVARIMEPFRGMFPSHQVSDRSVFDASLLFAMIVYCILGLLLHALITWLS